MKKTKQNKTKKQPEFVAKSLNWAEKLKQYEIMLKIAQAG